MIVQFHTPEGIVDIDSDTVSDADLAGVGLDRQKFNAYLAEQPRDLAAEIDVINQTISANPHYDPTPPDMARAAELLATSPAVITQPEMWELLRIFGRLHGIPS